MITSRNQTAISTVAKDGCVMEQLAVDEAISELLKETDVHSPSAEDTEHARDIVQQFACLPIAVNQAGAYIRSWHKSLATFEKLCKQRQKDILAFKSRFAAYDQTVLTTWNMNFDQVERDSWDTRELLPFFPLLISRKYSRCQARSRLHSAKALDKLGVIIEESREKSSIDEGFVQVVKNELNFDDAIEVLRSFSVIYVNQYQKAGLWKFVINPFFQDWASQPFFGEIQEYWRSQAIALVRHAFPRDEILGRL